MAANRRSRVSAIKLKKQTTKAPKGVHPYKVRFGGLHELGEEHSYPTEAKARQAIVKELDGFKPWCQRHNHAGLDALQDAVQRVGTITFHQEPQRLECRFDDHWDLWLVAEYWHTDSVTPRSQNAQGKEN